MILRSEKGAPLTFDELDGNFKELSLEIQKLRDELAHLQAELFLDLKFEQVGTELTIKTSAGKILGQCQLPMIKPHVRGYWQEDEDYKIFDWVVFDNKTYSCIKAHKAKEFQKEKLTCWELVIDPEQLNMPKK